MNIKIWAVRVSRREIKGLLKYITLKMQIIFLQILSIVKIMILLEIIHLELALL